MLRIMIPGSGRGEFNVRVDMSTGTIFTLTSVTAEDLAAYQAAGRPAPRAIRVELGAVSPDALRGLQTDIAQLKANGRTPPPAPQAEGAAAGE